MTKTKLLVSSVITSLMATTVSGCTQDLPPKPKDKSCSKWKWDDEMGVWRCNDGYSSHGGAYYYGGKYYRNKDTLTKSSEFKSYQASSKFKGGIGSGTKGGFGG